MIIGPIKLPIDIGNEDKLRYRWFMSNGTFSGEYTDGISRLSGLNYFTIVTTPPSDSSVVVLYDSTDPTNTVEFPFVTVVGGLEGPSSAQDISGAVNITVALNVGTLLSNVTYVWITNGVSGAPLTVGITQPDVTHPVFRINAVPPTGAEELIAYDSTDLGNWNLGNYVVLLFGTQLNVSQDLANLRILCASYLGRNATDFTIGGVDFFIIAANAARKRAEKLHNFKFAELSGTITIDGNNGASLDAFLITQAEDYVAKFKEITAISRRGLDGRYIPVDFTRADIAIERDRTSLEFMDTFWPVLRYPSDADIRARRTCSTVVQRGRHLFIHPGFISTTDDQVELTIDGYGWLRDYGSLGVVGGPEDFIVEHGYEYLQWATICNLNKNFKGFVPRQEGNLSEPVDERERCWRELLIWDAYQIDSNVTRSR